jgi:predicted O-methyltransferase YrrM
MARTPWINHSFVIQGELSGMDDTANLHFPKTLQSILQATAASGFPMASDVQTGSLLKTLAASKPAARFLELGTGTGLSTAWILAGMDPASTLVTVDNNEAVQSIAKRYLQEDPRVTFQLMDGGTFLESLAGQQFDFLFADTWPGKYTHLEQALDLLKPGALYIVDDMLPQPNWPPEHFPKVPSLISVLEARTDLMLTKMNWSTGLIVATKSA